MTATTRAMPTNATQAPAAPRRWRGVANWLAVGAAGVAGTLAAGCCDCGKNSPATSTSSAAELRPVQFAADVPAGPSAQVSTAQVSTAQVPAAQPRLPDVPPKVPDVPPLVPPPGKPPVPPPQPGRLPEQPPGQPDRPRTPSDDLGDANKALRDQNREIQKKLDEANALRGQVKHVVVLWLKKLGDKDGRRALVDGKEALRTIPGVVDVAVGECLTSDRKVVDSTYDVALVVTLKDEAALKAYGPHPTHQKLVADVIKPNVEKYVVYDFVAK